MFVDRYPHIKELYYIHGGPETENGREYIKNNQDVLDYEYSKAIDEDRLRDMVGGTKTIHAYDKNI